MYTKEVTDYESAYYALRAITLQILYGIRDEQITSVEQMWEVWDESRKDLPS